MSSSGKKSDSQEEPETPTSKFDDGEKMYEMSDSQRDIITVTTLNSKKSKYGRNRRPPKYLTDNYYHGSINFKKIRTIKKKSVKSEEIGGFAKRVKRKISNKSKAITKSKKKKKLAKSRNTPSSPTTPLTPFFDTTTTDTSGFNFDTLFDSDGGIKYNDKHKWLFETKAKKPTLNNVPSIKGILDGSHYHKGKINPVSSKHLTLVDICFSFDTTGSMYNCIDKVKKGLNRIITQLLNDVPGIKISIIAHGDYCDASLYYNMQILDFSNDLTTIINFVNGVQETGGGDVPECYEMALLEAQNLNWTKNANTKVLVVIGDAPPHKPEEYYQINWKDEAKVLVKQNVKLYGVRCLNSISSFYKELAEVGGGSLIELDEFDSMIEVFLGLCYREASEVELQNHCQQISDIQTKEGEINSVMPTSMPDKNILSDDDIMIIHNGIHDQSTKKITLSDKKDYEIAVGKAGCRFCRINGITYIEQNKDKKTKYAKLALKGKKVTWINYNGSYGLIVDEEIVKRGKN